MGAGRTAKEGGVEKGQKGTGGLADAASSHLGQLQNRHLLVINTQDYG